MLLKKVEGSEQGLREGLGALKENQKASESAMVLWEVKDLFYGWQLELVQL